MVISFLFPHPKPGKITYTVDPVHMISPCILGGVLYVFWTSSGGLLGQRT